MDILLRLGIVVVLALAIAGGWAALRWRNTRFIRRFNTEIAPAGTNDKVTILAFTSPSCGQCRTAQKPILEHLTAQLPTLDVRYIQVEEEPAEVERFKIMTLPATAVLAPDGHLVALNHGLAHYERLAEQVATATL